MKKEVASYILLFLLSTALITLRIKVRAIAEGPVLISTKILEIYQGLKQQSTKTVRSIVEAGKILEENKLLKTKLLELKQIDMINQKLRRENLQLSRLLGLKERLKNIVIPAEVTGWVGEYWEKRFKLNRGKKDGVKEGMAVIGSNGIVGQIRYVYENYSVAISNTDPEFSIHVEDFRSKVKGVAKGTGERMKVDYVPPGMDVKVGDLFVSTGIGGIFPPGVYVGRVAKVERSIEEKFLDIELIPTDRIENNRIVLIVGERPVGKTKKKAKRKR